MTVEVGKESWMTPIIEFLKDGVCEEAEKATMKCKCTRSP